MYSLFFIILILLSILIVGILANYAITHDKERMEDRRSEYRRYRAVFGDDLRKVQPDEDEEKENRENYD